MGQMVLVSGGELNTTDKINKFALTLSKSLSNKANLNILFIPTASSDAVGYIEGIKKYYTNINPGCSFDALYLCKNPDSINIIKEKIDRADLIYIGGGSTEAMIETWESYDIANLILKANENGTIITGISAGLNCWFKYSHSDSDYFKNPNNWQYKFVKGLNIFPYNVCPHYNEEGRDSFDVMLDTLEEKTTSYAIENETAIYINNDKISFIRCDKGRNVYKFTYTNGEYIKSIVSDILDL